MISNISIIYNIFLKINSEAYFHEVKIDFDKAKQLTIQLSRLKFTNRI